MTSSSSTYDLVVIGSNPEGLLAAYQLTKRSHSLLIVTDATPREPRATRTHLSEQSLPWIVDPTSLTLQACPALVSLCQDVASVQCLTADARIDVTRLDGFLNDCQREFGETPLTHADSIELAHLTSPATVDLSSAAKNLSEKLFAWWKSDPRRWCWIRTLIQGMTSAADPLGFPTSAFLWSLPHRSTHRYLVARHLATQTLIEALRQTGIGIETTSVNHIARRWNRFSLDIPNGRLDTTAILFNREIETLPQLVGWITRRASRRHTLEFNDRSPAYQRTLVLAKTDLPTGLGNLIFLDGPSDTPIRLIIRSSRPWTTPDRAVVQLHWYGTDPTQSGEEAYRKVVRFLQNRFPFWPDQPIDEEPIEQLPSYYALGPGLCWHSPFRSNFVMAGPRTDSVVRLDPIDLGTGQTVAKLLQALQKS